MTWKKNISLFLAGQAVSLLGSSTVQFAISWYVARETESTLMFALITISGFLPQVLISLFAGVWADRLNRKRLIILADAGIALVTLALAFITLRGGEFFWALMVISIIRSIGAGIQTPAVSAAITQLVPQDQLMRIGGINSSIQSVIFLLSPALAGAVLNWGAFHHVLFIDVITALVGIFILLTMVRLEKLETPDKKEPAGYFDDLKEGISYAAGSPFLRRVFLLCALFCFLLVPVAFFNVPMITQVFGESFGDDYWYLTINEVMFSVGAVLGAALLGAWGGFPNRLKTLAWGGLAFGATAVAIGLTHNFWFYLVVIGLSGLAMPFSNAPLTVMLQEKVEPEKQGRIFSLIQIITMLVMQLGALFFGYVAENIPLQRLTLWTGAGLMLLALALFRWKSFYQEGYTLSAGTETAEDSQEGETV